MKSKTKKQTAAIGSSAWLKDWQKRYDKAESALEDAKWERHDAQRREDRLDEKIFMLRREYNAATNPAEPESPRAS